MKNIFIFVLLLFTIPIGLQCQTLINFHSAKSSKTSQLGKIEQIGNDFSSKVEIKLPNKMLRLNLRKNQIKQYQTILTSDGAIPSKVEIYEDIEEPEKYLLAVIDNQFHSLLILEKGKSFSLTKTEHSQFIYEKMEALDLINNLPVDDYLPFQSENKSLKKARQNSVSGCFEFPIGFVCDYALYQFKGIPEIEAANLLNLAAVQALWGEYVFDAQVKFKVIGQIVYTQSDNSPWYENPDILLATIWSDFHNNWQKPKEWQKYKLLIKFGITGRNYAQSTTWGYGGGIYKEYDMGTALCKGFLGNTESIWLFSHELGHVFGAAHDENAGLMMSPYYAGGIGGWSLKSKTSINEVLNDLDTRKLLYACPQLSLKWQYANDSLMFNWQTNYVSLIDIFSLEYSSDNEKTWKTLYEIKANNGYQYQLLLPKPIDYTRNNIFRIVQKGDNNITSNTVNVIITSTEDKLEHPHVSVYINQSTKQLFINVPKAISANIYDMNGRLKTSIEHVSKDSPIDISTWNTGGYIVQIDGNPPLVFKILKMD